LNLSASPVEIAFRTSTFWSRTPLLLVGGFFIGTIGALSQLPAARFRDPHFVLVMGSFLVGFLVLVVGLHVWRQRRIGARPIRFDEAGLQLPGTLTRRVYTVPYERIRSVWTAGKGRNGRLIVDCDQRAFVYPLSSFAETGVRERFLDVLQPRLDPLRWQEMIERHALLVPWSRRKPWASWGLALLLIGVFLLQLTGGGTPTSVDSFAMLDFGANAGFLVERGEWYRLVTANLLHSGLAHIGGNLFCLVIYGALVEKQIGWRRTLLVVLATGLGAQVASALWMESSPFHNDVIMSVGFPGALFGLLGTLGVLNVRFGHRVPGGYRLSALSWLELLGVNLVIVPLISHQIDTAAHIGGLLSGLLVGALLLSRQGDIGEAPRAGRAETAALAMLGLIWIAGIAQAALTALDPARRAAEHRIALHAVRAWDRNRPALDNEFAWAAATSPTVPDEELEDALFLARRAVQSEKNATERRNERDTLATVQYRLHHFDAAIEIEQPLTHRPAVSGSRSQMARFLDARVKRDGVLWVGAPGDLPQLALHSDRLDVLIPEAMPNGAEIYALVRQGGVLKGMIRVYVAPNTGPLQLRDLPMVGTGQIADGVDPAGPAPEVVLAEIDRNGTDVDVAPASPYFYPFEKTVAVLP
jgi:rhomboid protease GluP